MGFFWPNKKVFSSEWYDLKIFSLPGHLGYFIGIQARAVDDKPGLVFIISSPDCCAFAFGLYGFNFFTCEYAATLVFNLISEFSGHHHIINDARLRNQYSGY